LARFKEDGIRITSGVPLYLIVIFFSEEIIMHDEYRRPVKTLYPTKCPKCGGENHTERTTEDPFGTYQKCIDSVCELYNQKITQRTHIYDDD
jgi:hypothetical protein